MKLQDCITIYDGLFNLTFNKSDLKKIATNEECAKCFRKSFPGFTIMELKTSPYIVMFNDKLRKED